MPIKDLTRPYFPILNKDSSLAQGLVSMVAAPLPQDLVQGTIFTGVTDQRGFGGIGGVGFAENAAAEAVRCTAPSRIRLTYPLTIATHVLFTAAPTTVIWGVTYDSAISDPFLAYAIGISSGQFAGQYNISGPGGFRQVGITITPVLWTLYSLIFTLSSDATGNAQILYVNGVQSGTAGVEAGTITYGTNPIQSAGEPNSAGSGNANMIFYDGMVWNRILSTNERATLDRISPWDLYWQPSNRAYAFFSSAAAAAGYLLVKN